MGVRDPRIATPADRRVAELAAGQHGVVSRAQLPALRLTDTAIKGRIRHGRLHRIHHDVYAVGHAALGFEGRALAAVLACGDGALLSHQSAAALWDLRASDRSRVAVTTTSRRGGREPRIEVHRARALDPADAARHRGVPVTAVSRTLVDLGGVVSQAALELEARFLVFCRVHHLPRPLVNSVVAGLEVDFFWPAARLVVETDGHAYHRTRHAFERDRRRDAELLVAGVRVLRLTHRRLVTEPREVARTVRALLHRRS